MYRKRDESPVLKISYWRCQLSACSYWDGKHSSTVSKSIGSCHSQEYTENNISLTSLTLSRLGASHTGQEKIRVRLGGSSSKFVCVASFSFRFAFRFVSRFTSASKTVVYSHAKSILWEAQAARSDVSKYLVGGAGFRKSPLHCATWLVSRVHNIDSIAPGI